MIDTLIRRPKTLDPEPVAAPAEAEDPEETEAEMWAAIERSCGYERPSRPSDAVAS